jgi:outer membrane protein TolC
VDLAKYASYQEASLDHRPEFRLLDIGVKAKRLQYTLEKQKLGPKGGVAFFMEVGRATSEIRNLGLTDDFNDPFNFTRAGFGFQLSGQIDFHGAAARIRKAKAEYFKTVYDRMIARKGLELEVKKSYLKAERMKENVKRARKAESMARQMLFLSKSNYEIGNGDEEEYTESLQAELLTRGQYFQAVFEYNVALAELEQKVGGNYYQRLTPARDMPVYEMFNNFEEYD